MIDPQNQRLFQREFSWVEFNSRVLAEAMDKTNPLLERLKFLGIVSSNFDEFFMVRVAGLEGETEAAIRQKAFSLIKIQQDYFLQVIVPELEAAGIRRIPANALNAQQSEYVRNLFFKELLPVLTPIAVRDEQPLNSLLNLTLYLVAALHTAAQPDKYQYAVVEIPKNFPRVVALPAETGFSFLLLEDLVSLYSKELFKGYDIVDQGFIRLTRAADMTLDEEKDQDFAKQMAEAIRRQSKNDIVRLEACGSKFLLEYFKCCLEIEGKDICEISSWMDLKSISLIAFQNGFDSLKRPVSIPRVVPEFEKKESIWEQMKQKNIWLHHPYDSFLPVIRFLEAAADDPDVLAIKQTLYRPASDSAVILALIRAAEKGKRVTVLVELKARFDEEKNIEWAKRLELAGANVLYGVAGLKTHAKVCLVMRREPEGIKRYAHLSTGNYNERTATVYSDIGFFTADDDIANDLSALFNMITGFSTPSGMQKIDVAPYGLRRKLKKLILRETFLNKPNDPGLIMAKMNSLVDPEIIQCLYDASKAGVKVKLNVRGICCLRPGVKDLSENIEVCSIVDMFLEHSRIFYFNNAGESEVYLSSADWMPRNLDRRIEIIWPVEDKEIKKDLTDLMKLYFKDNVKSWKLDSNGKYEKISSEGEKKFRVQEYLSKKASDQETAARKAVDLDLKPQKPVQPRKAPVT